MCNPTMSAPPNPRILKGEQSLRYPGSSPDLTLDVDAPSLPPLDATHVPYRRAAKYILSELADRAIAPPSVGIICGSGLSGLSKALDDDSPQATIPYPAIPGFPSHCTVAGHAGELVVGTLNAIPAICFRGRFHSYVSCCVVHV